MEVSNTMSMELFERLKNDTGSDFREAYIVIKNQYSRHPDNKELFCAYIDYTLEIAGFDMEFSDRKSYLEEAFAALNIFSESVEITEEVLELIKEKGDELKQSLSKINQDENSFYEKKKVKIQTTNESILNELHELCNSIPTKQTKEEFDELLNKIAQKEERLLQDMLTNNQNETYRMISKKCSDHISSKMEELNYQQLMEYNKRAAKSFKTAMDSFTDKPSKYKDKDNFGNLRNLVKTHLFSYNTKDLFNETLIYYNHVYSYIFNEVDEDLKFKLTEWSLETKERR